MAKVRDFKISVGSATDYEDLIAEVNFQTKAGFIISQEKGPGEFEISLHSFIENQDDNFGYSRNIEDAKIPLDGFREAFELAVSELSRLKKSI
jgi:hypothetical protein